MLFQFDTDSSSYWFHSDRNTAQYTTAISH